MTTNQVAICAECDDYALCRKAVHTWLCQSHYELAQDASADEMDYDEVDNAAPWPH